jgi:beta-lactamase class C
MGVVFPLKIHAGQALNPELNISVTRMIEPLMKQHQISGMAVGLIYDSQSYVYNYGLASVSTQQPVTDQTLFEIGSISKTFTANLAAYADVSGKFTLSDKVIKHFPLVHKGDLDKVTLLNLATHTTGGMPLQVPNQIQTRDQLIPFFEDWKPSHTPPSAYRSYSNLSIGLLGWITALSLNGEFKNLIKEKIFTPLGMNHSFFDIPPEMEKHYATGYTNNGEPIHMKHAILADEAYGIKTSANDLIKFVKANMQMVPFDESLKRAIQISHQGYFQAGKLTQGLIWEQYDNLASLDDLLEGNSKEMIFAVNPVVELVPPREPKIDAIINKTGSTSGFGAYVLFIPAKKVGVVLLANKNYPIPHRVTTAYNIIQKLLTIK